MGSATLDNESSVTVIQGTTHFTITVKHARVEKTRFGKDYLRQLGDSHWIPGEKLPDTSVNPTALLCSYCLPLLRSLAQQTDIDRRTHDRGTLQLAPLMII
jgi:hypothetical protein